MFDDQVPAQNNQQEPQDIFAENVPQSSPQTQATVAQPTQQVAQQSYEPSHRGGFNPKLIVILVAVLALLVIAAFGIQFALRSQQSVTLPSVQQPVVQQQVSVPPATPTPSIEVPQPTSVPAGVQEGSLPQPGVATQPGQETPPLPSSLPVLGEIGSQPPGGDSDSDGLQNDEELSLGTDPTKSDTDEDGLSDGDEVKKYHTNPLLGDSDSDGLPDGTELSTYKSDPLNTDTDGDGYLDGAEVKGGYSPTGSGKL